MRWAAILLPIICTTVAPGLLRAEPRTVTLDPGSQSTQVPSIIPQPAIQPPAVPQPPAPIAGTGEAQAQQPPATPVPNTTPNLLDLRGTKSAPLAVEVTNAADLQRQAPPLSAGQGRQGWPFLGWVLAIIAVIQGAVLGVQTIFLKRTVARMDAASEQQLRAYISVTPDNVAAWNQPGNISVSFNIENHGQTVGSDLRYDYGLDIIGRLPPDAAMPPTTDRITANNSLFPREKRPVRLEFKRTVSATEVADVETDVKRLYVWGTLMYRDTFGKQRTTGFAFSAGGPGFAQMQRGPRSTLTAWHWEFEAHHNMVT